MEDIYEGLKGLGLNTVDNLVKWMKNAGVLKDRSAEEKVRQMFADVDADDVPFEKLTEVAETLAAEEDTTVEEIQNQLGDDPSKILDALSEAIGPTVVEALKNAIRK